MVHPAGSLRTVRWVRPAEPVRRSALVRGVVAIVALLVAALGGALLVTTLAPAPLGPADVDAAVQRRLEAAREQERAVPPEAAVAYQAIGPSLVTVTAQRPGGGGQDLGSGVIVKADGTVLTALHVVAGADRVQVAFADGTTANAQVAAARPEQDVAVLAVDARPSVVVPAVLAGPPPVGAGVFAVGNPLGFRRSLSAGVVSGTDRSIVTRGAALSGLIQFDAAVNPGNSGGPLLNGAGQVVGIVTGLANPVDGDFFVGIGFAVPIATASGGPGGLQQ
jgi:S1-C subfamily serine protease